MSLAFDEATATLCDQITETHHATPGWACKGCFQMFPCASWLLATAVKNGIESGRLVLAAYDPTTEDKP